MGLCEHTHLWGRTSVLFETQRTTMPQGLAWLRCEYPAGLGGPWGLPGEALARSRTLL